MNRIRLFCVVSMIFAAPLPAADKMCPNVLFIAMDDLNDWIGCLGGHPQSLTPNLDRLAASGLLFTNAHCPAPACNPCRSAIFTGRAPNRSGLYDNRQADAGSDAARGADSHSTFVNHGYRAAGSGKMLHYFIDADSWDEYFPDAKSENPLPRNVLPRASSRQPAARRPLAIRRNGLGGAGRERRRVRWRLVGQSVGR